MIRVVVVIDGIVHLDVILGGALVAALEAPAWVVLVAIAAAHGLVVLVVPVVRDALEGLGDRDRVLGEGRGCSGIAIVMAVSAAVRAGKSRVRCCPRLKFSCCRSRQGWPLWRARSS